MYGFFDKGISWRQGMQLYNLGAFSLALYNLVMDPESNGAELGLDMLVHAYSFICLKENTGPINSILGAAGNFVEMGAIYAGLTSGCSAIPFASKAIKALDGAAHLLNAGTMILSDSSEGANTRRP